jgi:hypothetical protein
MQALFQDEEGTIMGGLLVIVGVGLMVVGYMWTVGTLFQRDGLVMGLLSLLFPVIAFYAALRHCMDRKAPSLTLLGGVGIAILGVILKPNP